jgi:hypothetical protein
MALLLEDTLLSSAKDLCYEFFTLLRKGSQKIETGFHDEARVYLFFWPRVVRVRPSDRRGLPLCPGGKRDHLTLLPPNDDAVAAQRASRGLWLGFLWKPLGSFSE